MIKPIRNPSDLSDATRRLADLITANGAGAFSDDIEVLATLIQAYERITFPAGSPSPIGAIRFRMEQQGLTPRQLEPFIGSRARVSEVLSGKRRLTLDMIRSLHEGLGIPYESLISKHLEIGISVRHGRMPPDRPHSSDVHPQAGAGLRQSARAPEAARVLHRRTRTQRAAWKMDQGALRDWQLAVLHKSDARKCLARFESSRFVTERLRKIARLSRRPEGPRLALGAFAELGVDTVILPALPGTFLDGAVMMREDGTPVIGLTLRHERTDNFWFTLMHEAAHIVLHFNQLCDAGAVFVDDLEIHSEQVVEREADALAGESLIPRELLAQVRWNAQSTRDDIVALAVRSRVHVAIVAGRWQRDHQNYKKFSRLIERGTIRQTLKDY